MNNSIKVMAQAFYGNKTSVEIKTEEIDRFVLGYMDDSITVTEKIDRTIINIPNAENIVIVYNKYQEEDEVSRKEKLFKEKGYELKPTVIIPEKDIKLYSRCIVCRIDKNGEFKSLEKEDYKKFMEYLAE